MANNDSTTSNGMTTPEGNQVNQKITRKKLLFLLFWIAEEDKAKNLFAESAQTRMQNIKMMDWYNEDIHKVHCPPIHKFAEFQKIIDNWLNEYGGKEKVAIKEIGIFSHAANDGPIIGSDSINDPDRVPFEYRPGLFSYTQLNLNGWSKINFYWHSSNTRVTFFGCNSANNSKNFAQNISLLANFINVEVGGQSASSFPSFSPSKRITSIARSNDFGWSVSGSYMVGSKKGLGKQALLLGIPVEPMRFYKNGILLYEKDQSFFNSDPRPKPILRR